MLLKNKACARESRWAAELFDKLSVACITSRRKGEVIRVQPLKWLTACEQMFLKKQLS